MLCPAIARHVVGGKGCRGRGGKQGHASFYCKERCGANLLDREKGARCRGMSCLLVLSYWTFLGKGKGGAARSRGRSCLLVPSYWPSLRKGKQKAEERSEEEGKEGKVPP